ncbi:hypothetical protein [Filimonas effusa]|uniref:Uncharacterized protein n=1 Tax=Filimonas effusa TaxID=2508721 RepID=A0A4Q1DD31_9BACT|nr:hypothetical protein [Filimonas effusa]RXK86888.1 hypothetical protein ESB13_08890 [Filimonas effusa]
MAEFIIDNAIRITTRFYYNGHDAGETQLSVSYSIYAPVKSNIPAMTGQLTGNALQQVDIKTSNGMFIKGQLNTTLAEAEMMLNANLFYSFAASRASQYHFEGTVATGAGKIPPGPPPYPLVLPPQSIEAAGPISTDLIVTALLFPYINIGREVTKTTQDAWLYFIEYNTAEAPADSLYHQLIAPAQTKDRNAMEQLAMAFLQDQDAATSQYFEHIVNIPVPFRRFPLLYDAIAYGHRGDTYENTLLKHLNLTDTEELKAWVSAIDIAVADQVWQNYFALTIIAGYNAELFIQLNKIILLHHLLQKLYVKPLPSFVKDIEALYPALLKATILLPGIPTNGRQPVFPLPPYANSYSNIVSN